MEEVLDRQDATIQDFLLKTSILKRISAPLCEASYQEGQKSAAVATERSPSNRLDFQDMLESLERANVFVIPLDDQREWYRYHQLFADLLRNRLAWTNALCSQADVRFRQAKLPLAQDLFQEAMHIATGPDGDLLPIAGEALIGLGHVLREWNELDHAARYLEEGIALIRQAREIGAVEGLIALSVCRQAQGDAISARQALAQAQRAAMTGDASSVYGWIVDLYEALLLHKQGDRQAMVRYLRTGSPVYGSNFHCSTGRG